MEMEDQYGLGDLRQLMSGGGGTGTRIHFSAPSSSIPQHQQLFSNPAGLYRNLTLSQNHNNPYDLMMMMPRDLPDFRSNDSAPAVSASVAAAAAAAAAATTTTVTASGPSGGGGCGGFEPLENGCLGIAGEGGTGRWPRQETLTLLEIRSRLDSKFKEANQKGPLWDEVSRIMGEEHNYQRSGKKCREKFENLYKYYKKTREGKAGRQDGKNYRFFRQLEALYGETNNNATSSSLPDQSHNNNFVKFQNNNPNIDDPILTQHHQSQKHYCDSLSISNNTSEFETSSSENNNNNNNNDDENDDFGSIIGAMDNDSGEKRRKRRSGKCWKAKIKHFIDSQMRKLIDKQEAWLEKLMGTLEQKEKDRMIREEEWRRQEVSRIERERSFWAKERAWIEARDSALMEALQKLTGRSEYNSSPDHQLGLTAAAEFQNQNEENIKNYQRKMDEANKKRKENSRTSYDIYFQTDSSLYSTTTQPAGGGGGGPYCEIKEQSPNSSNAGGGGNGGGGGGNVAHDSCFRFLMGEGDQTQSGLWENYGLRLNNGGDQT